MVRRIYCHDELIGMKMIPDVTARPRFEETSYLVQANGDGFRCRHEFDPESLPTGKRILLYGDSFTVGVGVPMEKRFGDLIEAGTGGTVYNFGLTGSGTDQQYLAHHHIGSKLAADLVILTPWVENIRRNTAQARAWNDRWGDAAQSDNVVLHFKPYFELGSDGELTLHNTPVPKPEPFGDESNVGTGSAPRLANLRSTIRQKAPWAKDPLQRLARVQPVPEYDDPNGSEWRLMKAIIERWHGELDCPILVCPIPMYQHIESSASPEGYQARFQELHRPEHGLNVVDVLEPMQRGSRRSRRRLRFETDIHFNESGHARFAEALLPAVKSLL